MEKNQIIHRALKLADEKRETFIDLLEDDLLQAEGLPKLIAVIQRLCEEDIIQVTPTFTSRGPNFLIRLTEKGIQIAENKDR